MSKKALLCGLNYPEHPCQLFGCINDCLDWEEVLREVFLYDTRVLIDQHPDGSVVTEPTQMPTKANILSQIGWLVSGAQPGDCLAFVFAGHGCQVRGPGGQLEEALVPEDMRSMDENGNPSLVMEDELHALFSRIPAGASLTLVLDCCHGGRMLDVATAVDSSVQPMVPVRLQGPTEANRTEAAWREVARSEAKNSFARPRFLPTINAPAPRQRRTPPGSGALAGRMTLDPGVTAFCLAAARAGEVALDASIRNHQRGVFSFAMLKALSSYHNSCTFEQLVERAAEIVDDIRLRYITTMDQHIHLSYGPHSPPQEVVAFDSRYATVAQHRMESEQKLSEPVQAPDAFATMPGGLAEASSPKTPKSEQGEVGNLWLTIHSVHNLAGDPCIILRLGHQELCTPPISAFGPEGHRGKLLLGATDTELSIQVVSPNGFPFGRATIDLRQLPFGSWHRLRQRLQDSLLEVELDVRMEGTGFPPAVRPPQALAEPAPAPAAALPVAEPVAPKELPNIFGTPNLFSAAPSLLPKLCSVPPAAKAEAPATPAAAAAAAAAAVPQITVSADPIIPGPKWIPNLPGLTGLPQATANGFTSPSAGFSQPHHAVGPSAANGFLTEMPPLGQYFSTGTPAETTWMPSTHSPLDFSQPAATTWEEPRAASYMPAHTTYVSSHEQPLAASYMPAHSTYVSSQGQPLAASYMPAHSTYVSSHEQPLAASYMPSHTSYVSSHEQPLAASYMPSHTAVSALSYGQPIYETQPVSAVTYMSAPAPAQGTAAFAYREASAGLLPQYTPTPAPFHTSVAVPHISGAAAPRSYAPSYCQAAPWPPTIQ